MNGTLTHELGWCEHFNHPDLALATLRLERCVTVDGVLFSSYL